MPILCLRKKKKKKKRILEVKNLPILANSKLGFEPMAARLPSTCTGLWKIALFQSTDSGWTSRKTFFSHIIPFWLLWFWWAYLMKRFRSPLTRIWQRESLSYYHLSDIIPSIWPGYMVESLNNVFLCLYTVLQCDLLSHPSRGEVCFSTRSLWINSGLLWLRRM